MFNKKPPEPMFEFKTGKKHVGEIWGCPVLIEETKELPMQDVIGAILKHIGMEIKYDAAKPEEISFVATKYEAPKATPRSTAKPSAQMKKKGVKP